jgi:hypothetical protein
VSHPAARQGKQDGGAHQRAHGGDTSTPLHGRAIFVPAPTHRKASPVCLEATGGDGRHRGSVATVTEAGRVAAYALAIGKHDTQEAMEMLTGEMAKFRIDDRVREAQAARLALSTRAGRAGEARSGVRRVVVAVAAAILWPIRH